MGHQFLIALKAAKDKTGRPIATEFLALPDPRFVPQYYQEIRLPIALDTIETKLSRHEYVSISALEADVKRMIANAKFFNDKRSVIYEDAERIRKTASNWMVKYNPAYRDPNYVAQPTPVAGGAPSGNANGAGSGFGTPTPAPPSQAPVRLNITHKAKSATPAPPPKAQPEGSKDFVGKSFTDAQDMLMEEMIKYMDEESELLIFEPFVHLPPRKLQDYYQVITHPVSLKSVQKRAKGVRGRNEITGVSDFSSWDAFEEEVSYIWRNCREYNEDGSEMYNLAGEFEDVFKKRLADAKAVVDGPQPTTLKIKMSTPSNPSIKLRFGAGATKESPAPPSARETPDSRGTPGVIVDAGALERQKAVVSAGVNGQGRPQSSGPPPSGVRNPFSGSRSASATAVPSLTQQPSDGARSASAGSPPIMANGVKSESQPGSAAMPPPALTQRTNSGSPHPQVLQPPSLTHSLSAYTQSLYSPAPAPTGLESRYRPLGKGAKDALLPQLTLQSHPQLNLSKPVVVTVPASNRTTHQSLTISLPNQHRFLQIIPHIPVALTNRPYRMFVSINGQRNVEVVRPGGERDKTRPLFEGRLEPGVVNRIEVEVLAAKDGVGRSAQVMGKEGKESVDWEKCTVFVHLLK